MTPAELASAKILPVLPAIFHPETSPPFPADLVGSKSLGVGTMPEADLEGGGLVIDYESGGERKRVVLAFNDLGMWLVYAGDLQQAATQD